MPFPHIYTPTWAAGQPVEIKFQRSLLLIGVLQVYPAAFLGIVVWDGLGIGRGQKICISTRAGHIGVRIEHCLVCIHLEVLLKEIFRLKTTFDLKFLS